MIIIGLTGSIGMGKTATANKFRAQGMPVFDSDKMVHDLMKPDGAAYEPIARCFPECARDGAIDRQKLGAAVFDHDAALRELEHILHPLVRERQQTFLKHSRVNGASNVLLDIPLLFETGAQVRCDVVTVVSAPAFLQAQRALSRPGMSRQKFKSILARQTPDYIKRRRADYVISTGLGHSHAQKQIRAILRDLQTVKACHWPPGCAGSKKFDIYGNRHA